MAAAELAVGAINGTGWPISESSLRTSTNCAPGMCSARSPPCLSDFEHGHRVEGDVDCAIEDPQQSVRCGFGQETFASAAGNGQDAPKTAILIDKTGGSRGRQSQRNRASGIDDQIPPPPAGRISNR